jgi:RNA-directed DNA polymerase
MKGKPATSLLRAKLASDGVVESAYQWLCRQRRHWPANSDVWDLRFHWPEMKSQLQRELLAGTYQFAPMSRFVNAEGETVHVWSARDAVVLKAMAMVLGDSLSVSPRCTHVKGHGGAKAAVREVWKHLPENGFVMRTDVKGFYDNIDQYRMLDALAEHVKDRAVLNLLWQVMRRKVTWGGLFQARTRGISRGCPLSPLLGAFFLHRLDSALAKLKVFYVRFMDDILVLAPTRWRLRAAVKNVNRELSALDLEKHPNKTFIGRIDRGFNFLGYQFGEGKLRLAEQTVRKHVESLLRLYEQQVNKKATPSEVAYVLGAYVKRWRRWCGAGLGAAFSPTAAFCEISQSQRGPGQAELA